MPPLQFVKKEQYESHSTSRLRNGYFGDSNGSSSSESVASSGPSPSSTLLPGVPFDQKTSALNPRPNPPDPRRNVPIVYNPLPPGNHVHLDVGPYSHLKQRHPFPSPQTFTPGFLTRQTLGSKAGIPTGTPPTLLYLQGPPSNHTQSEKDGSTYSSHHAPMYIHSAHPSIWENTGPEDDDYLHNPDFSDESTHPCSDLFSKRALCNIGTLLLLVLGILGLFAGYPILVMIFRQLDTTRGGFGLGGSNGSGQVPSLPLFNLVDRDTPTNAHKWTHPLTNDKYHVVFSDEFEANGRTFWPGDDPFWEAIDLYYMGTFDFEWYSPEAVNTSGGFLNIAFEEYETHNLNFRSGMVQSWNKFCFQGGYVEMSVILPGSHTAESFWPALWLMGNLGRAGYRGSTQGMWPYSYDSCDVGILANQTYVDKTGPYSAINAHGQFSWQTENKISYLEGMRTPSCTCPGEDHPGPNVNVARAVPELDLFEGMVSNNKGGASQSLQIAPFNANYTWKNTSDAAQIHSPEAAFNNYRGAVYQQAVSGIVSIPNTAYEKSGNQAVTIGVQWDPDWDGKGDASITWFLNGKPSWSVNGHAIGPDPDTEIGQRIIPREPMSIIINLGMADGFKQVKWDTMSFPAQFQIDYVRVYQKDGQPDRISCDPKDHPTSKYIQDHLDLYYNENLTVLPDKYPWPKNKLKDGC